MLSHVEVVFVLLSLGKNSRGVAVVAEISRNLMISLTHKIFISAFCGIEALIQEGGDLVIL